MENKDFKNVIAILDNDFGSLRIIKDNGTSYINDIDLTESSNNLLSSLEKNNNCKLFLLIREKMDDKAYEQANAFLPSLAKAVHFNSHLENILSNLKRDFFIKCV
jgi:hypothetical protein